VLHLVARHELQEVRRIPHLLTRGVIRDIFPIRKLDWIEHMAVCIDLWLRKNAHKLERRKNCFSQLFALATKVAPNSFIFVSLSKTAISMGSIFPFLTQIKMNGHFVSERQTI
jgi:hypothetical protein